MSAMWKHFQLKIEVSIKNHWTFIYLYFVLFWLKEFSSPRSNETSFDKLCSEFNYTNQCPSKNFTFTTVYICVYTNHVVKRINWKYFKKTAVYFVDQNSKCYRTQLQVFFKLCRYAMHVFLLSERDCKTPVK